MSDSDVVKNMIADMGGKDFSADVCMSLNNSISKEFAAGYK